MAIYQPTQNIPSTKAIDVLKENTFSVTLNTSDSVIAYQLTILDWDNNIVLEESKVVLEEPLYNGDVLYFTPDLKDKLKNGNDYKWRLRLYQNDVSIYITSGYITSVSGNTITVPSNGNIKVGMYIEVGDERHKITAISQGTSSSIMDAVPKILTVDEAFSTDVTGEFYNIVSDFLDTSPDFTLYARTSPKVLITNFKKEIDDRHYIFTGSYTQAEGVPMTYYQITLMLVQNNISREIYNTGKVYRADIKLDYDGYLAGSTYQIELQVTNEAGVTTTTGLKMFKAQYETVEFLTEPQLYLDCKRHSIRINWTTPIDFEPSVYSTNATYNGTVESLVGNTMQIEKGLDIKTDDMIAFKSKYINQVSVYDPNTGLLALRYAPESDITAGTNYSIFNYPATGDMLNLLINDPYRLSNSANILNNLLRFESDRVGYIGKTPENDNITFQFKLPNAFWDSPLTHNMRLLPLLRLQTESYDIRGFEVFINLNKLVFIRPAIQEDNFYRIPIKEVKNSRSFVLSDDLDFSLYKYIKVEGYDDILEILSYDATTKTVILVDDVPFRIDAGISCVLYESLSYDFYTLLRYFPLQEQGTWNGTFDYIWDDSESWNDELYWLEGSNARERIANTWYKARINGNEIDVRAGGI